MTDEDLRKKNEELIQELQKMLTAKDDQLAKANETIQAQRVTIAAQSETIASKDQQLTRAIESEAHFRLQNESLVAANSVSLDVLKALYQKVHMPPPPPQPKSVELDLVKTYDGDWISDSFTVTDDKGGETKWRLWIRAKEDVYEYQGNVPVTLDLNSLNGEKKEFIVDTKIEIFRKSYKMKFNTADRWKWSCFEFDEDLDTEDWPSVMLMSRDEFCRTWFDQRDMLVKIIDMTVKRVE